METTGCEFETQKQSTEMTAMYRELHNVST